MRGRRLGGETDLSTLLAGLAPSLQPDRFVFCTVPEARYGDLAHAEPIASMAEVEGLTLVLLQEAADREGLSYSGVFRCIRLEVHSSLHAVGLTARVAEILATESISANVIAGYYHDHVFVPTEQADRAVELLRSLAKGSDSS